MRLIEHIRFRMRQAVAPAVMLTLIAYFAYHTVSGNYGLLALRDLDREYEALKQEADTAARDRARIEARTARLRRDNLDPELLDQQARAMLGFSRRDEMVVLAGDDAR